MINKVAGSIKIIAILIIIGLIFAAGLYTKRKYYDPKHRLYLAKKEVKKLIDNNELKDGDIIFQTSLSRQSKAIQLATKSQYSHCGIIFKDINRFYVFEAVQPVKLTPLDKWIARGRDGKYIIKRLKNTNLALNDTIIEKMMKLCDEFIGKNYDQTFEWSDDKIYCSELIWKLYQRSTGIEIGKLEKLMDFDLTDEVVRRKMKERYGDKIPYNETVISPASIFNSTLLFTVKQN